MDYIIFSALQKVTLCKVVLTDDIACQWSKSFQSRQDELPEHLWLNPNIEITVAFPRWHINGHGKACKTDFCLSYMDGIGRTCGKHIETSWAHTNALGPSVREMGPGSQHEMLNDHWNRWNFHKIVGFHKCIALLLFVSCGAYHCWHRSSISQACQGCMEHAEQTSWDVSPMSSTFPEDTIQRWTAMVDAWKVDHRQLNPYEEPQCGMFIIVYIDVLTIVILSSYDCSRCLAPTHTRRCSGGVMR